jgi:peptidoglycan pentaglycine glycine transferase (the first glycine)
MPAVEMIGPERRLEWNDFATAHSQGHFMQLYEWGQVRECSGWIPHYFGLMDSGRIVAIALVLERRIPALGALFYSPRGPLWDSTAPDQVRHFARALNDFAHSRGGIIWRVDPYVDEANVAARHGLLSAGFRDISLQWSYWNQPRYIMRLDTSAGKDQVLVAMDRKDRYKVRHSTKHGVKFEEVDPDQKHLEAFYRMMRATALKKRIPVRDRAYFSTFLQLFVREGHAALFDAKKDEQTASAGISIRMGRTAWLMHLGSDYSVPLANWGLQWEMLSWAIDSGCTMYDFRGSATNFPPSPSDKGYGVYKFKQSFGAELVPLLGYFDLVLRPMPYRLFRYAERRLLPLGERLLEKASGIRDRFGGQ